MRHTSTPCDVFPERNSQARHVADLHANAWLCVPVTPPQRLHTHQHHCQDCWLLARANFLHCTISCMPVAHIQACTVGHCLYAHVSPSCAFCAAPRVGVAVLWAIAQPCMQAGRCRTWRQSCQTSRPLPRSQTLRRAKPPPSETLGCDHPAQKPAMQLAVVQAGTHRAAATQNLK